MATKKAAKTRKVKCRGKGQSDKCRAMFANMTATGTYKAKKAPSRKK